MKMRLKRAVVLPVLVTTVLALCCTRQHSSSLTACELIRNPDKWENKIIAVNVNLRNSVSRQMKSTQFYDN
jgi:hypothetical protein